MIEAYQPQQEQKGRRSANWLCPHCNDGMRIRNSVMECQFLRRIYLQCCNVNCGATFVAQTEIVHQLSPSAQPKEEVARYMAELEKKRNQQTETLKQVTKESAEERRYMPKYLQRTIPRRNRK